MPISYPRMPRHLRRWLLMMINSDELVLESDQVNNFGEHRIVLVSRIRERR